MFKLEVFDPPMCCSSGVCGPNIDPVLPRFAADLDWLKSQGVTVERYNLSQQPGAFVENPLVKATLTKEGNGSLPLILVNGRIASRGSYPDRDALAAMAGTDERMETDLYTDLVAELVAIGAAIGANCDPCLKFHFDRARKLGVPLENIKSAIATAKSVKEAASNSIIELSDRLTAKGPSRGQPLVLQVQPCCGPEASNSERSTANSGDRIESACC